MKKLVGLLQTLGCITLTIAEPVFSQYRPQVSLGAGHQLQVAGVTNTQGLLLQLNFALPTSGNRCERSDVHCNEPMLSRFIYMLLESSVSLNLDQSNFPDFVQNARVRFVPLDINVLGNSNSLPSSLVQNDNRIGVQILPVHLERNTQLNNTLRNSLMAVGLSWQSRIYPNQHIGFYINLFLSALGYRYQQNTNSRGSGAESHSFELFRAGGSAGLLWAPAPSVLVQLGVGGNVAITEDFNEGAVTLELSARFTRWLSIVSEYREGYEFDRIMNNRVNFQQFNNYLRLSYD